MARVHREERDWPCWSRDTHLASSSFPEVMNRSLFQQITRYLHFNYNEYTPPSRANKLYKRPAGLQLDCRTLALACTTSASLFLFTRAHGEVEREAVPFHNRFATCEHLLERRVHTVGTLSSHRGEPQEIHDPDRLRTGDIVTCDNGKVLVLAWKDKRAVKVIFSKHDASVTTISRRKSKVEVKWMRLACTHTRFF